MKKYKQLIIGILIGVLVSSGTIYAFTISSSEITYTTKTGEKTTVDKELDNLYEVYGYGTAISSDLLAGKTAYSNGTKLLGTLPRPTTVTGNAYNGDAGFLNGTGALTTSTSLNLTNYKNNNKYDFKLGGGEQVTFPSGYYDLPINVSNGEKSGGSAISAWSIFNPGEGNANTSVCVYDPETGRNLTDMRSYSYNSSVLEVNDYTLQRLAYGTGGHRITVVAKRNGTLYVGSTPYAMTNGQTLTVSVSGYAKNGFVASGWFE